MEKKYFFDLLKLKKGNVKMCVNKNDAEEYTVSIIKANAFALLIILVVIVVSAFIIINWKISFTKEYFLVHVINFKMIAGIYLFLFLSIILHELIHAAIFLVFCKNKKNSVKIGFKKELLTPYCYCREKLKLWQYAIGIIGPCIFLGIIPYIIAMFYKNVLILFLGGLNIAAAAGDILILYLLIKYGKINAWVRDHPIECGFIMEKF